MTDDSRWGLSRLTAWFRSLETRVRTNLHTRVVVSFLSVTIVVGALTEAATYLQARGTVVKTVYDRLSSLSIRRESDVHEWVQTQQNLLLLISGSPEFVTLAGRVIDARAANAPDLPSLQKPLGVLLSSIIRLGIAGTKLEIIAARGGEVVASSDSSSLAEYRLTDPYFVEGLRAPYIQKIYPAAKTGRPTLTISAPLRDTKGRAIGVIAADLSLERLEELLPQTGSGYPVEFYLVNRFGEFVSAARFGRTSYRRGVTSEGIAGALAGRRGIGEYRNYDGTPVMGAYTWLPDVELALLVEVPQYDAFRALRRMLTLQALIFSVGLAALVYAIGVVARRVTQPMLTTARAAERVAAGDFTVRAPVTTEDEVGVLAVAFNNMTDRLRTLYDDLQGQVNATRVALDALRQNEAMVHGIIDTSTTLVFVTEPAGRCVLVNRRFEQLFGKSREACDGRPVRELVPAAAAELIEEVLGAVTKSGRVADREWTLETREGVRTFVVACFPVRDASGIATSIGVIATDVTERKRVEDERREFEANVQHAQKLESLGVMAGGIAHDFNNILSAILSNAALGLSALDDPKEVQAALENITRASRRAADLTRQMLTYAGRGVARFAPMDLHAMIPEMESLARMSLSKKVEFELKLADAPLGIIGDSAQVSQVVLNLFMNAGDAIGDSGGLVVVTTERVATLPNDLAESWMGEMPTSGPFVIFSVQDNGRGMDDVTRQRIFEPFFTTKSTGRGLGLSAVLGIVKGMGGALTVHSELRRGTRFTLAFRTVPLP